MSPRFDDVFGAGALCALESDLTHPVLGACRADEHPDAFVPQAPRGAAMLDLEWLRGGRASVAASPGLWFFSWLDAGQSHGAGLIAHLAGVLTDWGVEAARCLSLNRDADSLLRRCGFHPWLEGPPTERHLLTATTLDVAPYVDGRADRSRVPQAGRSPGAPGSATRASSTLTAERT